MLGIVAPGTPIGVCPACGPVWGRTVARTVVGTAMCNDCGVRLSKAGVAGVPMEVQR
jgi:ribosomal protein L37AE/L43A